MSSILKVSTLQDPTNSNTALSIDTSGRVEIKQNHTATLNYATSGAWTFTGVPSFAKKITLVTHNLSAATQGLIYIRVTVGGTRVMGSAYKYTASRLTDAGAVIVNNNVSGSDRIELSGFNNVANLMNWILSIYEIETNLYAFNATVSNDTYAFGVFHHGTITTSGPIDGFDIIAAAGNLDSGKARVFWE